MAWLIAGAAVGIAALGPAADARRDRLVRTFAVREGRPIDIQLAWGDVELWAETRRDISVTVEPEAPAGTSAEVLPVVMDEGADRVLVRAQPADSAGGGRFRCRITVRAPSSTPLRVHVIDGRLQVSGWRGPVAATVERGPIEATDVAGIIRLETTSGDVTVRKAGLPAEGLLRVRTETGSVRVGLIAAPGNARVLLHAMIGAITSELDVQQRTGFGGRLREGTFGGAKALLSIEVVRGDIGLFLEP